MQLKMKRSQRTAGVISSNAVFCLDARVAFTPAEQASIQRYKLANQVIYNSDAASRVLDRRDAAHATGTTTGYMKSIGLSLVAAMKLNITIASLQRGQHIECKSLDELLGAEEAIMDACRNLKLYLETAATFDGREFLVDFNTGEPQIIAQAVSPQPALAAPREVRDAEFTEVRAEALPAPDAQGPEDPSQVSQWEAGYVSTGPLDELARWLERQNVPPLAAAFLVGFVILILFMALGGGTLFTLVMAVAIGGGFYALLSKRMTS